MGRKGVLSEWEVVVKSLSYILHQLMYLSISKYLDVFKNVLIHPKFIFKDISFFCLVTAHIRMEMERSPPLSNIFIQLETFLLW